VDYAWARDLLLAARHDIADRDRYWALFEKNNDKTKPAEETTDPTKSEDAKKKRNGKKKRTEPPLRHQPHTKELLDELEEAA
jgi:WhiB family redox-sensing transcriptional regulator